MRKRDARWALAVALGVGLVSAAIVPVGCKSEAEDEALLCYVGGTMRPAMEKVVEAYKAKTGQEVRLDHGGSGELLIRIETEKRGDLYVCHDPFLTILEGKGLGKGETVAEIVPVIVVAKGNPKGIHSLTDLGKEGVRLIVTDFEHSTLGHMLPTIFRRAGADAEKKIRANIVKMVRSGGQAANDVGIGTLDAAIVWNAVAFLRQDKVDIVPIGPEHMPRADLDAVTSATGKLWDISMIRVTVAALNCSKKPEAARKFLEFVTSPEVHRIFVDFGFSFPKGEKPPEGVKAG